MNFKILTLNCQAGYNPHIKKFLEHVFRSDIYDFFLLQEVNDKIEEIIEDAGRKYNVLSEFNKGVGKQSQLRILHRPAFTPSENTFISFSKITPAYAHFPQLGFLANAFKYESQKVLLGSAHLNPGFQFRSRINEINAVKKHLNERIKKEQPTSVIFGGDFNTGFPWENHSVKKILGPEFLESTGKIGATLHSHYTEPGNHLISRIGNFLDRLGIDISLKADHIFVDRQTSEFHKMQPHKLTNRVSDHDPVQLIIK